MSDPFADAARAVPSPGDEDEDGALVRSQAFAIGRSPERSAALLSKARAAGMSLELTEAAEAERAAVDWRELTRGLPVTRETLADPERAAAMQDDVGALGAVEKVFGGMSEIAWETKEGWQRGRINQRLADIGYRQSQGTATAEEVAEADRLEAQGAGMPRRPLGLVPRGFRAAAESGPLMVSSFTRSAEMIGAGALYGVTAGAIGGAAFGGVGAGPGALAGFVGGAGIGARAGMMIEVGKQEAGLAYREYIAMPGVTHEEAKLASTFVGIVNGMLEVLPLDVVLQIPGIKAFVGRGQVRDAFRAALKSTTGRAVVARAAARLAAGMTLEGLTEAAQELSTILGGQAAAGKGLNLWAVDWSRVGEAGLEGGLAGGVMGGPGLAAGITAESLEVRRAQARTDFFTALGEAAAGSKTFERLPDEAKAFVERAQERHGGPVESVSLPAEKLQTLFQKNDITLDQVAARMPEVARQLEETVGNSGVEVTIPIADFAANVARLPGYEALVEDLRVGDELTLREARDAEAQAKELATAEAKRERTAQVTVTPEQRVLQDVAGQLESVGMDPDAARTNAALWAAFSGAMGKRTGKDAWAFYQGLGLTVESTELGAAAPPGALEQGPSDLGNEEIASRTETGLVVPGAPGLSAVEQGAKDQAVAADLNDVGAVASSAVHGEKGAGGGLGLESAAKLPGFRSNLESGHEVPPVSTTIAPTRTPAFAKWFRGSKVADANGNPLVVFHGTQGEFEKFNREELGTGLGGAGTDEGFFFTDNDAAAKSYSLRFGEEGRIVAAYLQLRKPLVRDYESELREGLIKDAAYLDLDPAAVREMSYREVIEIQAPPGSRVLGDFIDEAIAEAKRTGADGVILRNIVDNNKVSEKDYRRLRGVDKPSTHYVVFRENQIKIVPETTLLQASPAGVEVGRRAGVLTLEHPESPLRLHVREEGAVLVSALLGFNERVSENIESIKVFGGQGYSTALYLRALEEAQRAGKGFASDKIRTEATERMYQRLQALGVPFEFDEAGDRWIVAGDTLAQVDLDEAWRTLLAETEIKALRSGVLMQRGETTPRGFVQFDAARSFFRVTLTGSANLSTFLHESGHAFLETLRKAAQQPGAPEDLKTDLAALESWLSVPLGGAWTEAQLERFARGFEVYLREGKAPSSELVAVFRTFKAWLTWIYRTLRGLDVELTDEVRGVMDRLLATEAEIGEARQHAALFPAFESADAAGMTEEQFRAYRERFERGADAARVQVEREVLAGLDKTMGDERTRAREDVEQLARLHPVFNLREFFRVGKRLDGQPVPEEIQGLKLDRGALDGLTDTRGKRRLQFYAVEAGGVDPDLLAPYFGFRDGAELVRELAEAPRREAWIRAEVQKRLEERYPESTVGAIRARAIEEVHGRDEFVRALRDELDAVGRRVGAPPARAALDVLRLGARERARTMTDAEMRPDRYRRAAAGAAREFLEALAGKKWVDAHDAKRRQLWNEFLTRETGKARAEVEKIREHLRSFEDIGKRQRIGKAGGNFLAAIDEILDGIQLRRESLRAVRRTQNLRAWVAQIEAEGGVVAPELKDLSDLKSYRTMTLDELRAVNAAVSNLEALARLKGKLIVGKERRDLVRTAHELAEHVRANVGTGKAPTPGEKPIGEKLRTWARRGDASMKKVEFLVRELDGGQTAGLVHSLVFQPLVDAQTARYDQQGQVFEALVAPFRKLDGERRGRYRQKVGFLESPRLGKMVRLSRRNVLSVVLNMGNEGNRERLLKGYGWTEEQVRARLGQLLDQGDVEIIEHVWKTVDSLWPAIRDLYERHAGLAPKRVEATPFTLVLADGTEAKLSGGYYPIAKAADLSDVGRNLAEMEEATSLWSANFFAPVVEHGFTKSRGKDMSPLDLSLDVAPRHLDKVIHYLTHYEAIRSVDRLLQVPELRQAVTEGVGREYLLELRPWLEAIAADGVLPDPIAWWSRLLRHLRFGSTIVLLFGKPATGIKQALGLFTSAKEIKRRHMVAGLRQFLRGGWKEYLAESGEGRHLDKQLDRDARELFVSLEGRMADLGRAKAQVIKWGALPIMLVQKAVNAITWYAAREQALEEQHADPNAYADSLVRMTQTGGGVKDLAAVQRGGEIFKMLTVFFSYRQILYNLLAEKTGKTGWAKTREVFARTWFLLLLPVVAEHLLMAGVKDKEDPEDVAKRLALELALLPTSTVPILGDIAEMVLAGREMKAAPWLVSIGRGIESAVDIGAGEGNVKDARAIAELIGVTMHAPTIALWNAGEWALRLADGDLEEPGRDLLLRSPSQWE